MPATQIPDPEFPPSDEKFARLKAAFEFISRPDDWKAPINMRGRRDVFDRVCETEGFSFDEILEAVRFFTATEPTVRTETIDPEFGEITIIEAAGYRAGPAGDH